MRGQWVWIVNLIQGTKPNRTEGSNSAYANKDMAQRKQKRIQADVLRNNPNSTTKVIIRRCMYFKDTVNENTFDDYCSICGGQLKANQPLTETYKPSTNKP